MRSTLFTLLLLIVTTLACGLAGWSLTRGNLDTLFGTPPTPVGQKLYDDFKPDQVNHIRVAGNGVKVNFYKTDSGWRATEPWRDRVDAVAAEQIINFTLGLRVEDRAPTDEIPLKDVGLRDGSIQVLLEDGSGQPLAKYALGTRSPWMAEMQPGEPPVPTVFIRPRDENHQDHVYICTGDINLMFKDGFRYLRDHHPLYFNPLALQTIRVRGEQGELRLGRETIQSPWRITKPLDIATAHNAMAALLEGLVRLQAIKIADRSEVTLPSSGVKPLQLAIQSFGEKNETLVEIYPPATPDAREVMATASDRPNTVFFLPRKPEPDLVSLADLPLTVNDLRDPKLTNLNIASLQAISIRPSTGAEILVSLKPGHPWMATIQGQTMQANEERIFTLLKTLTEAKAIDFETDAATDFSRWGLDRPILTLILLGKNNEALELNFGLDNSGGVFVNRLGSSSIMRVDQKVLSGISIRPYEWRHARLWSLSRVDLKSIERTQAGQPPLLLKYDFGSETWQATSNGEDRTAYLDQGHTNYMLGGLEGLNVSKWLAPDDADAITALATPFYTITAEEQGVDEMGDPTGIVRRELKFAPAAPGANPSFYYGKLDTEPHYFLLDREAFLRITTDVLENN